MYSGGKLGIHVFERRINYSDLSVWLPRLYVRLPVPPTPSEDVVFVCDFLYRSAVGEWRLIGRLTRLKIALVSNWMTLMSTLTSTLSRAKMIICDKK